MVPFNNGLYLAWGTGSGTISCSTTSTGGVDFMFPIALDVILSMWCGKKVTNSASIIATNSSASVTEKRFKINYRTVVGSYSNVTESAYGIVIGY